jgi:hypothetical protein
MTKNTASAYICHVHAIFIQLTTDGKGSAFIRKGKVGDWRNYFDDEMNQGPNSEHFVFFVTWA